MEKNTRFPLHHCHVMKTDLIINRLYMFFLGTALLGLFYYRTTTLSHIIKTRDSPLVPHLLVFISELLFTFLWVLHQAYRWRPITRTVYPDRLPGDDKFPPVDVFICTADPSKEPPLGVMNTVISAMALDYPPDKLAVYLSDDGGSYVTLHAVREAWKFSKWWFPFCRKYELKTRCPGAYFSAEESRDDRFISCSEFLAEEKEIEKKYNEFKESLEKNSVNASSSVSRDHAPIIEVAVNIQMFRALVKHWIGSDMQCSSVVAPKRNGQRNRNPKIAQHKRNPEQFADRRSHTTILGFGGRPRNGGLFLGFPRNERGPKKHTIAIERRESRQEAQEASENALS
ncbi:UNVERIFIED_CONTAM: Cellulose synthase-like protein G3 [Sesamum radiatum]|uniref:Cellulose synthase-like protein G3 n=1 Tax=Sesamum radiatum TaxID=300843 RepID=A0AAW2UAU1_SESRA